MLAHLSIGGRPPTGQGRTPYPLAYVLSAGSGITAHLWSIFSFACSHVLSAAHHAALYPQQPQLPGAVKGDTVLFCVSVWREHDGEQRLSMLLRGQTVDAMCWSQKGDAKDYSLRYGHRCRHRDQLRRAACGWRRRAPARSRAA